MSTDEDDEVTVAGEGGEGAQEIYPYGEYQGGKDEQLDRHGAGSALLPNGDIYEGEYYHGKRHGTGMYCFKNGARYTGTWRKGLKHGKGTFIYPDGSKYIGDWRKDFKHGYGTYYYINGDTYDGCWYKGLRHGLGTYTYKAVNVTYYGSWRNGYMEALGIINYPYYRYHGTFSKNLPKGPGCFNFDGKYMQHGFYINMRDPAFDYVGAEELELNKNEDLNVDINTFNQKGIVPVWRARSVTVFKPELLPPEPQPLLIKDSEDSLIDIIDYLQQQYVAGPTMVEGEERTVPSPEPVGLYLHEPQEEEPENQNEPTDNQNETASPKIN